MSKNAFQLILYPVLGLNINFEKMLILEEILASEFKNIKPSELEELIKNQITKNDLNIISQEIPETKKLKYFSLAKDIVKIIDFSKPQLIKLAEIGKLLKIDKSKTGLDFDIFKTAEINKFEYKKTVKNFSVIAAAIGFIPFLPISDFSILAVLHIGMISKISSIFEFKLEAKEFLKMIAGTIGAGIIFKITSKILCSLLPFIGWILNASVAFAGTYAIGILAKTYIEENGELSKESIKAIWEKSFEEGKEEFWKLKDYILDKKEELLKEFEKYKNKKESK